MQVSQVAKQYILSTNDEAKECFDKMLTSIQEKIKQEVLSTPLVSGYSFIRSILEKELTDFVETVISLMDYYAEGIYYSGKMVSRKKLKLKKPVSNTEEKYVFTQNDRYFIDFYKSNALDSFKDQFQKALVDYVVNNVINKKINGKWNLDGDQDYNYFEYKKQELSEEDSKELMRVINDSFSGLLDQFMDAVARENIQLFRRAQIEEYKNLGIDTVTFISEDEMSCCPVCNAKSGKIMNVRDSASGYGISGGTNHSFCNISIDPVISYQNQITTIKSSSEVGLHSEYNYFVNNVSLSLSNEIQTHSDFNIGQFKFKNVPIEVEYRIQKLIKKIQIYARKYMSDITFVFTDNITEVEDWFNNVKQHYLDQGKNDFEAMNEAYTAQDKLKFKVGCFDNGNVFHVSPMSFDSQKMEDVLIRKIIGDKVEANDWVKQRYNEKMNSKYIGEGIAVFKDPFITYLAQESEEEYLIESVVTYVNQPQKLKAIDSKIFEHIKENIFDSIEFF